VWAAKNVRTRERKPHHRKVTDSHTFLQFALLRHVLLRLPRAKLSPLSMIDR